MDDLLKTPLFEFHTLNKSKLINFAGWAMPFSYEGTLKEHDLVRSEAGFFDVSHMGRIHIDINEINKVNNLICSDLVNLETNKALYTIFTSEMGTALDDVIFWKFDSNLVLICNASNRSKISEHLQNKYISFEDVTLETCLIAIQGPKVIEHFTNFIDIPNKFYCNKNGKYIYARTGYTGEDGLEIMFDNKYLEDFLSILENNNIKPCGLGARDTLRLEASLPLYGFELTDDITPVEANLKWVITNKDKYLGKEIIDNQINTENHKFLKKFLIDSKNIARSGTEVISGDVNGKVTSGNYSPILKKSIGFALFDSKPKSDLIEFDIRGNLVKGEIINKRFLS